MRLTIAILTMLRRYKNRPVLKHIGADGPGALRTGLGLSRGYKITGPEIAQTIRLLLNAANIEVHLTTAEADRRFLWPGRTSPTALSLSKASSAEMPSSPSIGKPWLFRKNWGCPRERREAAPPYLLTLSNPFVTDILTGFPLKPMRAGGRQRTRRVSRGPV